MLQRAVRRGRIGRVAWGSAQLGVVNIVSLACLLLLLLPPCRMVGAKPQPDMGTMAKAVGGKIWEVSRVTAPVFTVGTLFLTVFEKRKQGCWRDAYSRGLGKMQFGRCPSDRPIRKGLVCHAPCHRGYRGGLMGPVCWQKACPWHAPVRCGLLCLSRGVSCTERVAKAAAVGLGMVTSAMTGLLPLTLVGGATMTIDISQFPKCKRVFDAEDQLRLRRARRHGRTDEALLRVAGIDPHWGLGSGTGDAVFRIPGLVEDEDGIANLLPIPSSSDTRPPRSAQKMWHSGNVTSSHLMQT